MKLNFESDINNIDDLKMVRNTLKFEPFNYKIEWIEENMAFL